MAARMLAKKASKMAAKYACKMTAAKGCQKAAKMWPPKVVSIKCIQQSDLLQVIEQIERLIKRDTNNGYVMQGTK